MKRYLVISILLLAGAVSCRKTSMEEPGGSPVPISINAVSDTPTKAITDTTVMPSEYTIWLSSFLKDLERTDNMRNYFTGIPYTYNIADSLWHGTPVQYWTYSGELDFLGIASDLDLASSMNWSTTRNTDGVIVDVPADSDGSSEVLYTMAGPFVYDGSAVDMPFYHTQTCLEFNFHCECEDEVVYLDGIDIHDAYTGGQLYVQQRPLRLLKWDVDNIDSRDVPVPAIDTLTTLTAAKDTTFTVVVLPKEQQHFTVNFRQRANIGYEVSEMAVKMPFEYYKPAMKWKMGVKYIYNFNIDPQKITFTAETANMDSNNGTIVEVQ